MSSKVFSSFASFDPVCDFHVVDITYMFCCLRIWRNFIKILLQCKSIWIDNLLQAFLAVLTIFMKLTTSTKSVAGVPCNRSLQNLFTKHISLSIIGHKEVWLRSSRLFHLHYGLRAIEKHKGICQTSSDNWARADGCSYSGGRHARARYFQEKKNETKQNKKSAENQTGS